VTPQTRLHPNPDHTITRVLNALRDTQPPVGLEARIARRLREAADVRASAANRVSYFAVILNAVKDPRILLGAAPRYTPAGIAVALLLLLALIPLPFHRIYHIATAVNQPIISPTSRVQTLELPQLQAPQARPLRPGFIKNPTATPVSFAPQPQLSAADQLALDETLAPSQSAPPMPLTAQERVLLRATRRGAPIEVAELDQLREPFLRARAEARERANLSQYIHGLLGPLATAQALTPDPTPSTPPPTDPQPLPDPEPPSPSSR
jgi:hypothetical protein